MDEFGGFRWWPKTFEAQLVILCIPVTFLFNVILTAVFGGSSYLVWGFIPMYFFLGTLSIIISWVLTLIALLIYNAKERKEISPSLSKSETM